MSQNNVNENVNDKGTLEESSIPNLTALTDVVMRQLPAQNETAVDRTAVSPSLPNAGETYTQNVECANSSTFLPPIHSDTKIYEESFDQDRNRIESKHDVVATITETSQRIEASTPINDPNNDPIIQDTTTDVAKDTSTSTPSIPLGGGGNLVNQLEEVADPISKSSTSMERETQELQMKDIIQQNQSAENENNAHHETQETKELSIPSTDVHPTTTGMDIDLAVNDANDAKDVKESKEEDANDIDIDIEVKDKQLDVSTEVISDATDKEKTDELTDEMAIEMDIVKQEETESLVDDNPMRNGDNDNENGNEHENENENEEKDVNESKVAEPETYHPTNTDSNDNDEAEMSIDPKEESNEKEPDVDKHTGSIDTSKEDLTLKSSNEKNENILPDSKMFTAADTLNSGSTNEKAKTFLQDARDKHFSRDSRQAFGLGIPIGPVGGITGTTTTTSTNREAASFLETLTEEEKRTRTRHVPDVEGFRRLHKSEIKSDLKVARSHHSFQPELFSRQASKLDRKGEFSAIENEKANLIDIIPDDEEYYNAKGPLPSDKILNPFIAPEGISAQHYPTTVNDSISSSGEGEESLSSGVGSKYQFARSASAADNERISLRSPKIIDSIKAFNPPRPPESIGSKKKNRLLRWERNPHEVEIDLGNYRKTVERTQEELQHAENEREKVEVYGSIFRDHFMNHLRIMREESVIVNREFQSLQEDCIKKMTEMLVDVEDSKYQCNTMSDLISLIMDEDTLEVLADETSNNEFVTYSRNSGIGGVTLDEKNRSKKKDELNLPNPDDPSVQLSSGWILPGNNVRTPYGDGCVLNVFGVSFLEVSSNEDKTSTTTGNTASNAPTSKSMKKNHRHGQKQNTGGQPASDGTSIKTDGGSKNNLVSRLLPPRICVRLAFGVGYFLPNEVSVLDKIETLSDNDLVSRWKNMTETAFLMKESVDTKAMDKKYISTGMMRKMNKAKTNEKSKSNQEVDNEAMDIDSKDDHDKSDKDSILEKKSHVHHKRVSPFDGGLLSLSGLSGTALAKVPLPDLEEAFETILFGATGVMGQESNPYLNPEMKYWEKQRYDLFQLQGTVLQLRNELSRQRGARKLNERSRGASEDRSRKVENLFIEMKADLNSLKERLRDELSELGITQERAEEILADYARKMNDVVTDDENSLPQKRANSESGSTGVDSRNTRRKLDEDTMDTSMQKNAGNGDENMIKVSCS